MKQPVYRCSLCGELTQMPKDMGCPHCGSDPCWVYDATLKVGDKVRILTKRTKRTKVVQIPGEIVGESRTRNAWRIKLEGRVFPVNFHKAKAERAPDSPAATIAA